MSAGLTVAELAQRLGGSVEGDGSVRVASVASLEHAGPGALSWLANERYRAAAIATRAGALLIAAGVALPGGRTCIRVADPELALCAALRLLGPPAERVEAGIHPSAVVAPDAEVHAAAAVGPRVVIAARARVGAETQLHAGVYVGSDVAIGSGCVLWPNVVVRERTEIGDRVIIHPNTTIGGDGFGYLQRDGRHVKIPQVGRVVIEDDVEIGANSAVDRAKTGVTRIGRGTKIDNLVQIAHNCIIGPDCILVGQSGVAGSAVLGRGVVLGAQSGIIEHCRVADGVLIAAKTALTGDVPRPGTLRGIPAVDAARFARQEAAARRLPELFKRVRELCKRIARLESSADHQV